MNNSQLKHYWLILLTVVAAFNYLDRFVLSLLMEPIKQEFQLTDSHLGFLTGFSFAVFYALAGIPIARWSDRGNRNTIVFATTTLWSAMVAMCGLVGSFAQLLLVRVGVAVGEAGCFPPAQSLIADYFERSERPRAMAIYWMCGPLSIVIGYLGGGWLAENFGWRTTFVIIGVPGILLALLVKLTLHEPREKLKTSVVEDVPLFKEVLKILWGQQTFRYIAMAFSVSYFFSMGLMQWLPTFFIRSYNMEVGELGKWLALVWGVCGILGAYLGGFLATRYAASKESLQMRGTALIFVIGGLSSAMVYLSSNQYSALIFLAISAVLFPMCSGAVYAAIQSLVNVRMRAVALALIFLLANLVGFGLGPLAVGVLSDLLAPTFGGESLRYALAILSPGFVWVAFYYWKASKTIESDISAVELSDDTYGVDNLMTGLGSDKKKYGCSEY